jgi:hypothetical protein
MTLAELLISSLITIAITAAVLGLADPSQHVFQAQPEASDVQQRLRVSVDSVQKDLVMAGAGTYAGPAAGPLSDFIATVFPYQAFGDNPDSSRGTFFRHDTISFLYVPSTASQSTLASPLPPGALDLQLDAPPNCPVPTTSQLCGLGTGDRLLVFDQQSQWDIFSVNQVGVGAAVLQHRGAPAVADFQRGALVAHVRLGTYHLKSDDVARVYQLMRHDGWATDLPVVDDVVALHFQYFGDPEPPRRTATPLDDPAGPWTTYGPAPPLVDDIRGNWPPGENCAFLVIDRDHVPRLGTLGGGGLASVELTPAMLTDGPWCPDGLAPNRFDADLFRVRKIRVTVRVQSALASLRGPAGTLFLKGGTARTGYRYVPDLEVQFDVTPRNLNLDR